MPRRRLIDMLPPLADERRWQQNSVIVLVWMLCGTCLIGLVIGGIWQIQALVITAFMSAIGGIGTVAVGVVGGNTIARKGIYALAAGVAAKAITKANSPPTTATVKKR